MSLQPVVEAVENRKLDFELAIKYLNLYVAELDWSPHLSNLWRNVKSKFSNEDLAKEYMRRAISCTILLPLVEKTQIPDPPSNLLFWCTKWNQFNEHDWFDMLIEVFNQDIEIASKRNIALKLGVVTSIDVPPMTRQAYNWLYEQAALSLSENDLKNVTDKFTNLVRAYGGAVICNMFMNHKHNISKVLNWRSGYFFEKELHKVYTIDQIVKIKTTELNKTNQKYIKKLGERNE